MKRAGDDDSDVQDVETTHTRPTMYTGSRTRRSFSQQKRPRSRQSNLRRTCQQNTADQKLQVIDKIIEALVPTQRPTPAVQTIRDSTVAVHRERSMSLLGNIERVPQT